MSNNTWLLLTATVNVGRTSLTARTDPQLRLADYSAAAAHYGRELGSAPILLVENSRQPAWPQLSSIANLEYRTFWGNDFPPQLGKGVGEMNIIEHALQDDSIGIKNDDVVVKVTGRLIVQNIQPLMNALQDNPSDISCDLSRNLQFADSRCFAARASILRRYLLPQRQRLDDSHGYYFENALAAATLTAIADGHRWTLLPVTPRLCGITGTSGEKIDSSLARFLLLDGKRRIKQLFFQQR